MNKKKIQTEYNKKIKLINDYNKDYYNKNLSSVSDKEYDEIKKNIFLIEKKYKFLNSEKSPSKIIGHKPSKNFAKVQHKVPMLSLANAFDEDDLLNFEKKILNFISQKDNFEIIL